MKNKKEIISRILLLLLLGGILAAGLVFLKRSSGQSKSVTEGSEADVADSESLPIAVPDTTFDATLLPAEADTVINAMPADSIIGRDTRPSSEAGYEDGYANGMDDGAAGTERANFDDSSTFPTAAERASYARSYAEGYERGYSDAVNHRQFGI